MIDIQEACALVGHRVRVLGCMGDQFTGTLIDVCDQPFVTIDDEDGKRWTYEIGHLNEIVATRPALKMASAHEGFDETEVPHA